MATPEIIENQELSLQEFLSNLDPPQDPLVLATRAVAKLRAAGLPGYIKFGETPLVPEAEAAQVIPIRRFRSRPIDPSEIKLHDHKAAFVKTMDNGEEVQEKFYQDYLKVKAARENSDAFEDLLSEHKTFLRLKVSSYFLTGGDNKDLEQEALIGFYKAVRDYDGTSAFRSFLELCVVRQLITAIKAAVRFKHIPLNTYVSFSHTPGGMENEGLTLGEALPSYDPEVPDLIAGVEGLRSLVRILGTKLTRLEADTLRLFLDGNSYEEMASQLGCDTKTIDNALQRIKRKITQHQKTNEVLN